jgi:hypothetical protein
MGPDGCQISAYSKLQDSTSNDSSSYRYFFVAAPIFGLAKEYSIWISLSSADAWSSGSSSVFSAVFIAEETDGEERSCQEIL